MYKIYAIEYGAERELNITPYEDIKLCKADVIELNKHYLTKLLKQSILDCISIKKDKARTTIYLGNTFISCFLLIFLFFKQYFPQFRK